MRTLTDEERAWHDHIIRVVAYDMQRRRRITGARTLVIRLRGRR